METTYEQAVEVLNELLEVGHIIKSVKTDLSSMMSLMESVYERSVLPEELERATNKV